jgi:RHS repeat-associated protein
LKQSWFSEQFQFDKFGNSRRTWDGSGDPQKYNEVTYSAEYGFAYPTLLRSPAADPSGSNGSDEPAETLKEYDLTTGLVTKVTDRQSLADATDDRVTATEYIDPLLRSTAVVEPNGARHETRYSDLPGRSSITSRSPVTSGVWRESTVVLDGFGRKVKTLDKRDEGVSVVEFRYDGHGRQTAVSAPYFEGTDPGSVGWGRTEFDAAGRVSRIFIPSGASGMPLAAEEYSFGISPVAGSVGTFVVRRDATGRSTRQIKDAAGRILRIDEPTGVSGVPDTDLGPLASPVQATFFRYSGAGFLSEISQGGQKRLFLYDPFGRVLRQRIPEQEPNPELQKPDPETGNSEWTSGFEYDSLGNTISAIDANGTHIDTTFDRLNRPVSLRFSDGTPENTFRYDQAPNGKGRQVESANSYSKTRSLEFDKAGNLTRSEQITDGISYATRFHYNLDGSLVEADYPSGKKVFQEFGLDGKLRRLSGTDQDGTRTYSNGIAYAADGKTARMRFGNGRWETADFDPSGRLQRTGIGASSGDTSLWRAAYEYGEIDPEGEIDTDRTNGSITRITVRLEGWPDAFKQVFRYDPLKRLSDAVESSAAGEAWSQHFAYDRFGNRVQIQQSIGGNSEAGQWTADPDSNRFAPGQGFSYDRNGNVTSDPSGRSYIFDGQNKQVEIRRADGSLEGRYVYDADGRRVKTETPLETTVYVYAAGRLIAEYSTSAPVEPNTRYLTYDHLDSPRIITGKQGEVLARRDYMPFGEDLFSGIGHRTEEQAYSVYGGEVRQGFAGYLDDRESGLNFAEARMYDSGNGRFTSVDPLASSADVTDPQSLNRYAYTRNDPVNLNDPTGLFTVDDWYVTDNGQMEVYRTEDEFDRFYVFDENRKVFVLVAQLDKNSKGLVRFPSEGFGFTYYNPGERGGYDSTTGERVGPGDHYLLPVTAAALFGFTNQLKNDFGVTLALGDMSSSNGSDPWDSRFRTQDWNGHHSSHGHMGNGTGQHIDFRYVDSHGNSKRGNWAESPGMFSRGRNQAVFDLAKRWGFGKSLRGLSVPIRGTRAAKGHNDHGHLGFDLSRKKPKILNSNRRRWYMRASDFTFACDVDACTNQ